MDTIALNQENILALHAVRAKAVNLNNAEAKAGAAAWTIEWEWGQLLRNPGETRCRQAGGRRGDWVKITLRV